MSIENLNLMLNYYDLWLLRCDVVKKCLNVVEKEGKKAFPRNIISFIVIWSIHVEAFLAINLRQYYKLHTNSFRQYYKMHCLITFPVCVYLIRTKYLHSYHCLNQNPMPFYVSKLFLCVKAIVLNRNR